MLCSPLLLLIAFALSPLPPLQAERQLGPLLSGPVISLLDQCPAGLWPRLHAACQGAAAASDRALVQVGLG